MRKADRLVTERLLELETGTMLELKEYGRSALGESALDEWLLPVVAGCGWLFVARLGKEIIGSAEVIRCAEDGTVYLEGIYVRPAFQNRGYGSRMLTEVMLALAAEGYERMTATLDPGNEGGRRMYGKAGFRTVRPLRDHYGPGRDRLLLEAALGEPGGVSG